MTRETFTDILSKGDLNHSPSRTRDTLGIEEFFRFCTEQYEGSSTITLPPRERIHHHHEGHHQQQHLNLTIFDKLAGVNKRRASVLTGLEADRLLGESVSLWAKLVFLATNIPYWLAAFAAGYDWFLMLAYHETKQELHVCGHPAMYFLIGTAVALSSTIMHGSQMRLGSCFCCAHPNRSEVFHEPEWQRRFKRVDVFCATSALFACIACRAWQDLVLNLSIAFPLFIAGIFLKRRTYYNWYLLTHGLWHIVTAALAWDAVMNRI